MKEKVHKTITLQVEYVENQSVFIPDDIRERSCAGEIVRMIGNLIEKGKISKGEGEVWLGYKAKYSFTIDNK